MTEIKTVYLMGIGGIAMGTLATMLIEKGYRVSGSDQNLYPPMSTHLESLGVPVFQGYRAENLMESRPDAVIIGNVIRRDNPEARLVLEQGLPYLSMPQAIDRFFLRQHRSLVVAGTHGKSTTSALLAWVLTYAGLDPSAFIGAFLKDWQRSHRVGQGPYMVLEGDEYDTAFFDKGPKFMHYRPHIGILTSVEFDHADIFADFAAVQRAFAGFIGLIAPGGSLIVNADDPNAMALSSQCRGDVLTYGCSETADWQIKVLEYLPGEVRFTYRHPNTGALEVMRSHLPGRHNALNTLAVMAAASLVGIPMELVQEALLAFSGVRRRQDVLGEARGVIVMDDFAHHPTAVVETLLALRRFYPERRLVVAFEPRTNSSRRNIFQESYATAFGSADCVCIKEPPGLQAISAEERLDTRRLVEEIRRSQEAHFFEDADGLLHFLVSQHTPSDIIVCMSNGSFDGLPRRLLEALLEA